MYVCLLTTVVIFSERYVALIRHMNSGSETDSDLGLAPLFAADAEAAVFFLGCLFSGLGVGLLFPSSNSNRNT